MKNNFYLFLCFLFIATVSGCAENQTRVGEGAAIGGILGAAAGGIIGHQTHSDAAGILIGGAVGAAGGAAVGAQIPKDQQQRVRPTQTTSQVTIQQVVEWTKDGTSGSEIINRIQATHSMYSLTNDDLSYLKQQGVSQRVIETMQAAH